MSINSTRKRSGWQHSSVKTERAAADNIGSLRVLQKCGFKIIGKNKDFANGRGQDTEEYILRLDPDQANE
jgi:hypothetical protein